MIISLCVHMRVRIYIACTVGDAAFAFASFIFSTTRRLNACVSVRVCVGGIWLDMINILADMRIAVDWLSSSEIKSVVKVLNLALNKILH